MPWRRRIEEGEQHWGTKTWFVNDGLDGLNLAIFKGNMAIARMLIDAGADVNERNREGATPLHYAAYADRMDFIDFLIEKGANPAVKSRDGYTPLDSAINAGNFEMVKNLVSRGLSFRSEALFELLYEAYRQDRQDGTFVSYRWREIFSMLLDAGPDLRVRDEHGCTLLHQVCSTAYAYNRRGYHRSNIVLLVWCI